MQRKRLKTNSIYMDLATGELGILRRDTGLFGLRKQWELEFISSVMPEELNRGFKTILKNKYALIGEL